MQNSWARWDQLPFELILISRLAAIVLLCQSTLPCFRDFPFLPSPLILQSILLAWKQLTLSAWHWALLQPKSIKAQQWIVKKVEVAIWAKCCTFCNLLKAQYHDNTSQRWFLKASQPRPCFWVLRHVQSKRRELLLASWSGKLFVRTLLCHWVLEQLTRLTSSPMGSYHRTNMHRISSTKCACRLCE